MADITMCIGEGCALKNKCYRHTAIINNYWQSWFVALPEHVDGICQLFWSNENACNRRRNDNEESNQSASTPNVARESDSDVRDDGRGNDVHITEGCTTNTTEIG